MLDKNKWYRFFEHGTERTIGGLDFSAKITVAAEMEAIQVWRKGPGSVWSGLGQARNYCPVEYWLVKVAGDEIFFLEGFTGPGARKAAMLKAREA